MLTLFLKGMSLSDAPAILSVLLLQFAMVLATMLPWQRSIGRQCVGLCPCLPSPQITTWLFTLVTIDPWHVLYQCMFSPPKQLLVWPCKNASVSRLVDWISFVMLHAATCICCWRNARQCCKTNMNATWTNRSFVKLKKVHCTSRCQVTWTLLSYTG